METEEKIVYSIIETAQKGVLSDDSKINERVVRAFLQKYRASVISEYTKGGQLISDECFQTLGELTFTKVANREREFVTELPKIIQLQNKYGMFILKNGESIPVLNAEEYALGLKSIINGNLPKAKFITSKATIYIGRKNNTTCGPKPADNFVINDFQEETIANDSASVTAEVFAVLDNPDDSVEYDWTSSPYPANSEIVEEMTTRILRKEYNIILNVKADNVTDGNQQEQTRRQVQPQGSNIQQGQ